jgi:imidazolonepropionase-like amidohydrolase
MSTYLLDTTLDCTGAEPYSGEVLIEGNRISAVAKRDEKLPRNGPHILDGYGTTLMPGLTEAHTDLSFVNEARL